MKQISIISAKGGVGKTTIASLFASFSNNLVMVDCDTESNDLRLILHTKAEKLKAVKTNQRVYIEADECIRCGLCKALCHFDAVSNENGVYRVEKEHCQACDLCLKACPVSAIQYLENATNSWGEVNTQFGPLVYAQLALGEDLNGSLIAIIRDRACEIANEQHKELILIDGPPAVGYAVASSITGVDLAVVVIEPGPAAVHDLYKAVQLSNRYETAVACLINKSDLNPEMTQKVKTYCNENNIPLLGELKFDIKFMESNLEGALLSEVEGGAELLNQAKGLYNNALKLLN